MTRVFALFLTNDKNYKGGNSKDIARQKSFLLVDGPKTGTLSWNGEIDGKKVGKSRTESIILDGIYHIKWESVHESEFNYLLIEI